MNNGDTKKTINRLRDEGYRVIVSHKRPVMGPEPGTLRFLSNYERRERGIAPEYIRPGGLTMLAIVKDDEMVGGGVAYCMPGDSFCRRIGTSIALGRALQEMEDHENIEAADEAVERSGGLKTTTRKTTISRDQLESIPLSTHTWRKLPRTLRQPVVKVVRENGGIFGDSISAIIEDEKGLPSEQKTSVTWLYDVVFASDRKLAADLRRTIGNTFFPVGK
jgi:hypothetical protein